MKIYTKTGDRGKTSLLSGQRVPKTDRRIAAYGTVDELNAYVGLLKDQDVNHKRRLLLENIQNRLFTMGSMLAADTVDARKGIPRLNQSDTDLLEKEIDAMQHALPPMKSFILPGGHIAVSFGHIARTVCRRAERLVIDLAHHDEALNHVIRYLNRLSDYCFVLCRKMAQELGVTETIWSHNTDDQWDSEKKNGGAEHLTKV